MKMNLQYFGGRGASASTGKRVGRILVENNLITGKGISTKVGGAEGGPKITYDEFLKGKVYEGSGKAAPFDKHVNDPNIRIDSNKIEEINKIIDNAKFKTNSADGNEIVNVTVSFRSPKGTTLAVVGGVGKENDGRWSSYTSDSWRHKGTVHYFNTKAEAVKGFKEDIKRSAKKQINKSERWRKKELDNIKKHGVNEWTENGFNRWH